MYVHWTGVGFNIYKGEFCAIVGTSGSGKSTLLNLMAGIEKASGGQILIKGKDVRKMSEKQLAKFRQKYLGFVFQSYNLLNSMTALENVELAAQICKEPLDAAKVLEEVGLGERMANFPAQLSGGEQQMLAVGRALMSKPKVIMMDEPSLGLAPIIVQGIFDIIKEINRQGVTVLLIEQNANMALKIADLAYVLETGNITMSGTGAELLANEKVREAYLGKNG